jgi:hypothetical protein
MKVSPLLLAAALCAPVPTMAQDAPPPESAPSAPPSDAPDEAAPDEAVGPSLDLVLHRDPTLGREDQSWGAVRVTAKLDTTMIYLDGTFLGEGKALLDRVIPGVHLLEAKLASGRSMRASILVRPGSVVDYAVHLGDRDGEKAYAVLMNVVAIVGSIVAGSTAASTGNVPIPTDAPGLITGQDAMKAGNTKLPRP